MVSILDYFTQGSRIFLSSWKRRISSKKYDGNAQEICQKVIQDCWNGRFLQTSTGNFIQFWTRDFGWSTNSLLKLGYQKEVQQSLRYAINRFKQFNKITTTLTPRGKPFDFPIYSVDTLPWLIHSIKLSKLSYHSHRFFLNKEIRKFFVKVIDPQTGLVKPNKHFSSMKDFSVRKSSCYDNCMVGMLAKDLEKMKLDNPFKKYNYPELIKRHFWHGEYFYDDLSKNDYVAGDANIFPFLCGLIKNEKMLKSVIKQIEGAILDEPFPLKYTYSRDKINFVWQEFFLRNYESDAIWMHMGPLYVNLIKQVDKVKAKDYREKYKKLIEKHGNFLEVFNSNGKPFSTSFYYCDSGMLWAANYLVL